MFRDASRANGDEIWAGSRREGAEGREDRGDGVGAYTRVRERGLQGIRLEGGFETNATDYGVDGAVRGEEGAGDGRGVFDVASYDCEVGLDSRGGDSALLKEGAEFGFAADDCQSMLVDCIVMFI